MFFLFVCFSFNLQKVKKKKKNTQPQLISVSVKDQLDLSTEQEEKWRARQRERRPYKIKQEQFLWKNISFKKLCWQKRENTVCPERLGGGGVDCPFMTSQSLSRAPWWHHRCRFSPRVVMSQRGVRGGATGGTREWWERRNRGFGCR